MAAEVKRVGEQGCLIQRQKADGKYNSIQRYYGWLQLKNIKQSKKKRADTMYQTLLLVLFRVKGTQFVQNVQSVSTSILDSQY